MEEGEGGGGVIGGRRYCIIATGAWGERRSESRSLSKHLKGLK